MIPFDFAYYRPDTIAEASQLYCDLETQGKKPLYYGGGSEIISMARLNNIYTGAVIDLKAIPECNVLKLNADNLIIGSAVTLAHISESDFYPLMSKACARIADHTMQCKITLGGNICGTIIYKEAILPLLLSDCTVVVASGKKLRPIPITDVFHDKLLLAKGEFIVQFIIEAKYLTLPYYHIKKTKNEKIDYPILSLSAIKDNRNLRIALSGICAFPFRSQKIESIFSNKNLTSDQKMSNIIDNLPAPVLNDIYATDQYRLFVLQKTLQDIEKQLGR